MNTRAQLCVGSAALHVYIQMYVQLQAPHKTHQLVVFGPESYVLPLRLVRDSWQAILHNAEVRPADSDNERVSQPRDRRCTWLC